MTKRNLSPALALILAALLAVTSITLAIARGQTRVGGTVVLCSGALYVPGSVNADGNPTTPHLCPDMALGLVAGLAAPAPEIARPAGRAEALAAACQSDPCPRPVPSAPARGPPVLA